MNQGLKFALQKTKGANIIYRLRELLWELRYAWQRAWSGYDNTDVFELGYNFAEKMPTLLKEFKENNIALFTDGETGETLSEEETDAVLDNLIFLFENCNEDHVYKRLFGVEYWEEKDGYDKEKWTATYKELNRCQEEAMRLFSKWCWRLWY